MASGRNGKSLGVSRRAWLGLTAVGGSLSGWLPRLAARLADDPQRRRACILLWMSGGPSQLDTFDLKPGHPNGGQFRPIDTSVAGIQISEHLPELAKRMQHLALVRSMSTPEGEHSRAAYHVRTGYLSTGPVRYPTLGSLLSKELGRADAELPNFVSVSPLRSLAPAAFGPGFLGPKHAPLIVGDAGANFAGGSTGDDDPAQMLRVKNLELPAFVSLKQADSRLSLLEGLESEFLARRPDATARSHLEAYRQAAKMMRSTGVKAFSVDDEPDKLRDAYGRNQFGQACLLARRLIERGVPFVEVGCNGVAGAAGLGWDTHQNNFESVKLLSQVLDPAWSRLIDDLKSRGLLERTLIVWAGEFGRTPKINTNSGRDHFPAAWSTVLAGGGIRGGQVVGRTSADGMEVTDRPASVPDFLATISTALGVDPLKQNTSNVGRPIRIVDPAAKPLDALLASR